MFASCIFRNSKHVWMMLASGREPMLLYCGFDMSDECYCVVFAVLFVPCITT